jgi:hypothetical protein
MSTLAPLTYLAFSGENLSKPLLFFRENGQRIQTCQGK